MILTDTSVWVSHLRWGELHLESLLLDAKVACHPFILGELACGNLKNRKQILSLLQELPSYEPISQEEWFHVVENHQLMGKGMGFVDIHLLASALLYKTPLWTQDKRLAAAAEQLQIAYQPPLSA